jgi:hypothetical protein
MFTTEEIREHLAAQGFHNVSDVTVKMLMERMELEMLQEKQLEEQEQLDVEDHYQQHESRRSQDPKTKNTLHGLNEFKTLQQRRQERSQVRASGTAKPSTPTTNPQTPSSFIFTTQTHPKSMHTSFSEPSTAFLRPTIQHRYQRNNRNLHTSPPPPPSTFRSKIPKLRRPTTTTNAVIEQPQPYFSDADKFRISGRIKFDPITFDKRNPMHAKAAKISNSNNEDDKDPQSDLNSDRSVSDSEPEDLHDDTSSEIKKKKWTLDGEVLNSRNSTKQPHPIDHKFFTSSARYPTYKLRTFPHHTSSHSVPSEDDHEYDSSFIDSDNFEHNQSEEECYDEDMETFRPYHPRRSSIGKRQIKELKQRGLLRGYGEGGFRRTDIVDRAAAYRAEWNSSPFLRRLER